jgi:hypothetical protein
VATSAPEVVGVVGEPPRRRLRESRSSFGQPSTMSFAITTVSNECLNLALNATERSVCSSQPSQSVAEHTNLHALRILAKLHIMTSAPTARLLLRTTGRPPSREEIGRKASAHSATPRVPELRAPRQTRLAPCMTSLVAKLAHVAMLHDVYCRRRAAIESETLADE